MADTVKVTPASKKIEFFDADSTPFQGKISLDTNDNLVLESPNDIYLGDSSATLSIATDMLFSASKKIAASANNVDITIGDTSSLTGNDIIIDSHTWSVTATGDATFAGDINLSGSKRIYFKSTDTYIGSDNDSSEDLHIGADGHIELEADNDTIIKQQSTELARFTSTGLRIDTGVITTPAAASGGYKHVQLTANNNLYGTNRTASFYFRAPNSNSQPHMLVYESDRAAIATGDSQSTASPKIWLLHDYYQPILDQTTDNSIAAEDFGLASASSMVSSAGTATNDPVILTLIDSGDTNSGDAIMAVGTGTSGGGSLNQISDGKLYFKIDDSGDSIFYKNVGIGTTSPDYTLDVAGNIGVDQFIYHNGDADTYLNLQTDDARMVVGNDIAWWYDEGAASKLHLSWNGEADVEIGNAGGTPDFFFGGSQGSYNGRMGIGTTSPATPLHVVGASYFQTGNIDISQGNYAIRNASAGTNKIRFPSSGVFAIEGVNVGINDSTPSYKLDVNGTGRYTGDLLGNSRIRCDKGLGEVEFNSTDGVFLIEEYVAPSGTPTTPLYNSQNQNITSITTYGNCVRISGTGTNASATPVSSSKYFLFAVVLGNADGSVADTFQSFDATVFVSVTGASDYVHRKTIKCLYEGSSTNLIYSYVDEMENFTTNNVDVKVDMTNGNAQIINMSTSNIQVARVYIDIGDVTNFTGSKIAANNLDFSWEFTGLKDEAHVG